MRPRRLLSPTLASFLIVNRLRVWKGVRSINEPLGTVTTKDRFALIQPEINGMRLDILFRMLQPHELAGAMGFPTNYIFKGAKTAVIKQIGNAVEVNTARALVKSLLTPSREVM